MATDQRVVGQMLAPFPSPLALGACAGVVAALNWPAPSVVEQPSSSMVGRVVVGA